MSEIDYQALREAAQKAKELGNISRYTKATIARLEFKEAATPDAVLALLDELEAAEKRIAELEKSEEQLINERAHAESALADMYFAATGDRTEWSNWFGFSDAVDAVVDRIADLEAKQPSPVVPAALPENDDEDGHDIDYLEPSEVYALGRTAGWNACRAAMLKSFGKSVQLDEVGSWNNHRNTPTDQDGNHTEQNLDMVDHFGDATKKAMLHGSEPETDNTNQQFESLSRGDK